MLRRWFPVYSALILVGLLLLALGGAPVAEARDVTVNMGDRFFEPATLTVNVGDTVTWRHQGNLPHDVTADNGAFSSPRRMANGQTFTYTATTAGTFTYLCTIHAQVMKGTLIVQAAGAPGMPRSGAGGMADRAAAEEVEFGPAAGGVPDEALPVGLALAAAAGLGVGALRRRRPA